MAALITRCPACGTMFKVVPDQLKVSQGWVRCGHCTEVFDASAHLQSSSGDTPAQPAPDSGPVATGEPAAHDESAASSSLLSQIDDAPPSAEPDSMLLRAEAQDLVEDPRDRPFELRREDLSPHSELTPSELEAAAPSPPLLEELTFVRQAREQARWERPAVRGAFVLLLAGLGLLLAAQVAVHDRDRLAAAQPSLRPVLGWLCALAGCRVQPPRQIESVAIDSSSFNTLRPGAYRLQVTLRNQGALEVAIPALELTLTDSQDLPVLRRVLLPPELGARRAGLAPASEWSGSVALAVIDNSLSSRVAGYRLLAFYP
jgi:predicted Zn finger-like uncharacterized protein